MAGRGRPKTPKSKLKTRGTFRADRHDRAEPAATGQPYKIGELAGDALQLWERVVPELVTSGVAKSIDSAELFAMCEWWNEYRTLQRDRELDRYKRMCAMAAAYKQFRTIAARFGLTPADRASLDIDVNDDEENPFAAFLASAAKAED